MIKTRKIIQYSRIFAEKAIKILENTLLSMRKSLLTLRYQLRSNLTIVLLFFEYLITGFIWFKGINRHSRQCTLSSDSDQLEKI